MEVEMSPMPSTSQSDKDPAATVLLPEPLHPVGPTEDDPAECTTLLASLPETAQSTPDLGQAIGPYLTCAGIDKTSFSPEHSELPTIQEVKNGHVIELYNYFNNILKKSKSETIRNLLAICGHTEARVVKVRSHVARLVNKYKKLKCRRSKSEVVQFMNKQFCYVRSSKLKQPGTLREKELMEDLSCLRKETKYLKRKLAAVQNEVHKKQNEEEKQRKVLEKQALIDAVDRQGGFWKTPAMISRELAKLRDKDENAIKYAIYNQLQYVHRVLQVTVPEKDFFQLSKTSGRIKVDFTKEEMKARLMAIVKTLPLPSISSKAHSNMKEFNEECYVKKRKLFEEMLSSKMERTVQSKQEHLESLLQNPNLLIGKTIDLGFGNVRETLSNWCKGVVIGIAREDENPLLTEFCVDFTQSEDQNRFEWIYILMLIQDLKNNDLIIHST